MQHLRHSDSAQTDATSHLFIGSEPGAEPSPGDVDGEGEDIEYETDDEEEEAAESDALDKARCFGSKMRPGSVPWFMFLISMITLLVIWVLGFCWVVLRLAIGDYFNFPLEQDGWQQYGALQNKRFFSQSSSRRSFAQGVAIQQPESWAIGSSLNADEEGMHDCSAGSSAIPYFGSAQVQQRNSFIQTKNDLKAMEYRLPGYVQAKKFIFFPSDVHVRQQDAIVIDSLGRVLSAGDGFSRPLFRNESSTNGNDLSHFVDGNVVCTVSSSCALVLLKQDAFHVVQNATGGSDKPQMEVLPFTKRG